MSYKLKLKNTVMASSATAIGQEFIDNMVDGFGGYFTKLSVKDKDYLIKFNSEYYLNNLKQYDPPEQLHKGNLRRECYRNFISRRECVMGRMKAAGLKKHQSSKEFRKYIERNAYQMKDRELTSRETEMNYVVISDKDVEWLKYSKKFFSKETEIVNYLLDKDCSFYEIYNEFSEELINDLGILDNNYAKICIKSFIKKIVALISAQNQNIIKNKKDNKYEIRNL